MLCASGCHDCFLFHGTEKGEPGNCIVPKYSCGTRLLFHLFSTPALASPFSGRPPCSGCHQGSVPRGGRRHPLLSVGGKCSTVLPKGLLQGCRPSSTFRLTEAGLLSEEVPRTQSCTVCTAVGPAVTVAAGAGFGTLGQSYCESGRMAPSPRSSNTRAWNHLQAAAAACGRDSFSLRHGGLHEKDCSASGLVLVGKALVLCCIVLAQVGEGILLRGATCAWTVLASHRDFFLTGRQRDFASGVLRHSI